MNNVHPIGKARPRRSGAPPPPRPPEGGDWRDQLVTKWTANGPKNLANVANAIAILENDPAFAGALAFDLFAERIVIVRACAVETEGPFPLGWADVHDIRTAAWLQRSTYGLDVEIGTVASAVVAVAKAHAVHPLRDRLSALVWDGVPRGDTWLTTYLGAEDTPYVRDVGPRWLISGIARVYRPGCKADHVLVLEGPQGKKKSTACRKLSLGYFTDEIPDLANKDAAMQLHGVWIVEFGELDALNKHDVTKVKAFVTRTVDRYRAPWGRHVGDHPRQCIFAGSTNQSDYLKDETGGRRFWPVRVGSIDIDALERDAEQLWAEARVRFEAGEAWWLADAEAIARAAEAQGERYQGDSWDARVSAFVASDEWTTVSKVLTDLFGIEEKDHDQVLQNRVGRCLKSLGWERRLKRTGKGREWRYFPPVTSLAATGDKSGDTTSEPVSPSVTTVTTVTSKSQWTVGDNREEIGGGVDPGDAGDTGDTDAWEEGRE